MSPMLNRATLCLWYDGTAKKDVICYAAIKAAAG